LYDDDRTFDTMIIVLMNRLEGKHMADHENITTTPTPVEDVHGESRRGPSPSQLAAAVEAAYILEAVRK
jgi:hypothetical protein